MNAKISSDIDSNKIQQRDFKKIRSVIARYKNKSTDIKNSTIEANILKTFSINRPENEGKYKLSQLE